ncbi:hypothetical protein T4B_5131, partial [Trichinella pseudospiralis]
LQFYWIYAYGDTKRNEKWSQFTSCHKYEMLTSKQFSDFSVTDFFKLS